MLILFLNSDWMALVVLQVTRYMRKLLGTILLLIFLTGCVAPDTGNPGYETPTPANWQDRIRECVSGTSFLIGLLPELDKFSSSSQAIEVTTNITPTSRGCITLPEDIFPVSQRALTSDGTAFMGYVSNWEEACGGAHAAPLPGNCTGDGYEAGGDGTVTLTANSASSDVPRLIVHFVILTGATP